MFCINPIWQTAEHCVLDEDEWHCIALGAAFTFVYIVADAEMSQASCLDGAASCDLASCACISVRASAAHESAIMHDSFPPSAHEQRFSGLSSPGILRLLEDTQKASAYSALARSIF